MLTIGVSSFLPLRIESLGDMTTAKMKAIDCYMLQKHWTFNFFHIKYVFDAAPDIILNMEECQSGPCFSKSASFKKCLSLHPWAWHLTLTFLHGLTPCSVCFPRVILILSVKCCNQSFVKKRWELHPLNTTCLMAVCFFLATCGSREKP